MLKKQHRSTYPRLIEMKDGSQLNFCGIGCSADVLGGRWKLLIIAELFGSKKRFAEIKKAIPEISDKMLAESLKGLLYHHLIARDESSGQVEYSLTDYGITLKPVLEVLYQWGEKHIALHGEKVFV